MTLKECYTAIEGDYNDVMSRLMTEKLVSKFVVKFLNDESYNQLVDFMKSENIEEAFRAAHTLKGVSQNLSFTKLYEPTHDVTEALRANDLAKAKEIMPKVDEAYLQTITAIKSLD